MAKEKHGRRRCNDENDGDKSYSDARGKVRHAKAKLNHIILVIM